MGHGAQGAGVQTQVGCVQGKHLTCCALSIEHWFLSTAECGPKIKQIKNIKSQLKIPTYWLHIWKNSWLGILLLGHTRSLDLFKSFWSVAWWFLSLTLENIEAKLIPFLFQRKNYIKFSHRGPQREYSRWDTYFVCGQPRFDPWILYGPLNTTRSVIPELRALNKASGVAQNQNWKFLS